MKIKILVLFFIFNSFIFATSHLSYDIKIEEENTLLIGIEKGISSNEGSKNYYVIRGQENLEEIAVSYRISMEEILRINNLKNRRDIKPGQVLYFDEIKEYN